MYIQYSFLFLNFRFYADFLNIYDGNSTSDKRLRSMSGRSGNNVQSVVQSTGSGIFINFLSDWQVVANGFRIQYSAYGRKKCRSTLMTLIKHTFLVLTL